jgi:hypothetical protein
MPGIQCGHMWRAMHYSSATRRTPDSWIELRQSYWGLLVGGDWRGIICILQNLRETLQLIYCNIVQCCYQWHKQTLKSLIPWIHLLIHFFIPWPWKRINHILCEDLFFSLVVWFGYISVSSIVVYHMWITHQFAWIGRIHRCISV